MIYLFFIFLLLMPTQLGKHWWPDWSLVSGIRIDYLSPTLYLTDIILMLLIVLVLREKRIDVEPFVPRHVLLFLSLISYLLSLTFLSPRPLLSLYWIARYAQIPLVAWMTYHVCIHVGTDRFWRLTRIGLATGILWTMALATAHVLAGRTLGWFWILGERSFTIATPGISTISVLGRTVLRPYATFPHPNALAGFLAISFLCLTPFRRPNGLFIRFSRAVALVGVTLSASRLAIASLFIVLFISLSTGQTSVILVFPSQSAEERVVLARAAVEIIRDHPLFGVGPGQFLVTLPHYLPRGMWLPQPVHNIPLLLLSEFGIVGSMLIVVIVWKLLTSARNVSMKQSSSLLPTPPRLLESEPRSRRPELGTKAYSLLLFFLLTSLGDHYWLTVQQNRILAGIVAGLCISTTTWSVWGKRRGDENDHRPLRTS